MKRLSEAYKYKLQIDEHIADPEERRRLMQAWTDQHIDPNAKPLGVFRFVHNDDGQVVYLTGDCYGCGETDVAFGHTVPEVQISLKDHRALRCGQAASSLDD